LKFPGLKIAGYRSPPFRELTEEEDKKVVEAINKASPDVLWIGLGGAKQELWMYNYKNRLKVPVMVGVGAAFDFLSGTKKQAPKWMQKSGLEWLFRLITEPGRLWKRYILGNSIFIYLVCKELIGGRLLKEKNKNRRQKGKTVK
jgi:N-acetylglucosaminyldiphosphoundecaprenol N-acetyl-beta-D-mannosaminyltransferase